MKDDNKSILKDALTNYNDIMEASNVNAKEKLAEEFPEKFNTLLKEEIKNKSKKESYKKIDENNLNENQEESVMKDKKETKKVVAETKVANPFNKKVATKGLQTEEFDITELDVSAVGSALENADEDDEVLTMEEIESEINGMEDLDTELGDSESNETPEEESEETPIDELIEMRDKLDAIIQSMGGSSTEGEEEEFETGNDEEFETEETPEEDEIGEGLMDKISNVFTPEKAKNLKPLDKRMWNTFPVMGQQGAIYKAVLNTSDDEKLNILSQFKSNGNKGTLAYKDGKVIYGSPELQSKRSVSATAPNVSSQAIGSGGVVAENDIEEGFLDTVKQTLGIGEIERIKNINPNDINQINAMFNKVFANILNQYAAIKDAANKTSPDQKYAILQQYANDNGQGTLRTSIDDSGQRVAIYGEPSVKSNTTSFAAKGRSRLGEEEFDNTNTSFTNDDLSDEDIDAILNSNTDDNIDETHGVTYGERRKSSGRHNPNADYLSSMESDQSPLQESKTKLTSLINENKKLTKKVNETTKLVEGYKAALDKYRTQLKDMAVFNSNLAYVNNLFVNESLALTHDDKVKIIKEFKKVNTIVESKKMYNDLLSEMKKTQKTLTESVEDKVSTSVQPSSKNINEVIEKTAYQNNEFIQKMLKNINYGGKK